MQVSICTHRGSIRHGSRLQRVAPKSPYATLEQRTSAYTSHRPATAPSGFLQFSTSWSCTSLHRMRHVPGGRTISPCLAAAVSSSPRLQAVLDKIDALNSQDPRTVEVDGKTTPYELAYSCWLTDWVHKLTADGNPAPSEELLIVARGQHIRRWVMPRKSYPEGKASYLKWREDLKKMHSKTVTGIMKEAGYSEESCAKVESMMLKKNLKVEAENQIVEDALCLVFLERQLAEFRLKETEEKMIDIIRKTWKKMGEKGRAAALALAPSMGEGERAVVLKALSD